MHAFSSASFTPGIPVDVYLYVCLYKKKPECAKFPHLPVTIRIHAVFLPLRFEASLRREKDELPVHTKLAYFSQRFDGVCVL